MNPAAVRVADQNAVIRFPRKGVVHDAANFLTRHDLSGDPNCGSTNHPH